MKLKKREHNCFWFTLGLTLFLLLTAIGLIAVDCQGRKLSFGDDTPAFRTEDARDGKKTLKVHVMGIEQDIEVTKIYEIWNLFLDFSCIPHK